VVTDAGHLISLLWVMVEGENKRTWHDMDVSGTSKKAGVRR